MNLDQIQVKFCSVKPVLSFVFRIARDADLLIAHLHKMLIDSHRRCWCGFNFYQPECTV